MNKDQQDYEAAVRERDRLIAFTSKPRCATCMLFANNTCEKFGPIPPEYRYQPNDCEHWDNDIPF
jgi:hypothetical protein